MEEGASRKMLTGFSAGAVGLLLVSLLCIAVFGKAGFFSFLSGPAAGWAQAIGSVAAIAGTYWLGQETYLRQVELQKRADAERDIRTLMVIRAVFEQCKVFFDLMENFEPGTYKSIHRDMAGDALDALKTVPVFLMPGPDLVRHLSLARLALITHTRYLDRSATNEATEDEIERMKTLAKIAMHNSRWAINSCDRRAEELRKDAP